LTVINPFGPDPGGEMDALAQRGMRAFRIHPKLSGQQPMEKWLRPEAYRIGASPMLAARNAPY